MPRTVLYHFLDEPSTTTTTTTTTARLFASIDTSSGHSWNPKTKTGAANLTPKESFISFRLIHRKQTMASNLNTRVEAARAQVRRVWKAIDNN
jgi:hypothetical protein